MTINCDVDRFVREVLEHDEYGFLFRDLTVVDIGCNVGTFSLWLSKLAKQIYAIDISKQNIDNFNLTIDQNQLTNIQTFVCGIAGNTRMRKVRKDDSPGGGAWALTNNDESDEVQTYSLADFMNKEGITHVDVLKIDTEGAEEEITGASDFPHDKVSWIIGEDHGNQNVKSNLEKLGYTITYSPHGKFLARR